MPRFNAPMTFMVNIESAKSYLELVRSDVADLLINGSDVRELLIDSLSFDLSTKEYSVHISPDSGSTIRVLQPHTLSLMLIYEHDQRYSVGGENRESILTAPFMDPDDEAYLRDKFEDYPIELYPNLWIHLIKERNNIWFPMMNSLKLNSYIDDNVNKNSFWTARIKAAVQRGVNLLSNHERQKNSIVDTVVLSGGGAKCLSLVGAVDTLMNQNVRSNISVSHIVGTSGGALVGLLYALGANQKYIERVISETQLSFMANDSRLSYISWLMTRLAPKSSDPNSHKEIYIYIEMLSVYYKRIKESYDSLFEIYKKSSSPIPLIDQSNIEFSRKKLKNFLSKNLDIMTEIINVEAKTRTSIISDFNFSGSSFETLCPHFEISDCIIMAYRNSFNIDLARSFICDSIEDSLLGHIVNLDPYDVSLIFGIDSISQDELICRIRNINFREFKVLVDVAKNGKLDVDLKDFTACFTAETNGAYQTYYPSTTQNTPDNHQSITIADAVRASMNLPFVYKHHTIDLNGMQIKAIDGGLTSNLSMVISELSLNKSRNEIIGIHYYTEHEIYKSDGFVNYTRNNLLFPESSKDGYGYLGFSSIQKYLLVLLENKLEVNKEKSPSIYGEDFVINAVDDYMKRKSIEIPLSLDDIHRTFFINTHQVDTMHFSLSTLDKKSIFDTGRKCAANFLDNKNHASDIEFYKEKVKMKIEYGNPDITFSSYYELIKDRISISISRENFISFCFDCLKKTSGFLAHKTISHVTPEQEQKEHSHLDITSPDIKKKR